MRAGGIFVNKKEILIQEAEAFLSQCYDELGKTKEEARERAENVKKEIIETGTYEHTYEELAHGAKMAWRHHNRCIGRLFWDTLHVFDARHVQTPEAIFQALLHHIDYATNNGKIRSTITVFPPQVNGEDQMRIWNHQLIRYAGYKKGDQVVGDTASIHFTQVCEQLGWEGEGTNFDVLPLVIQLKDQPPQWREIPRESILEVPIHHPEINTFSDLNIKWYGVPIIADMKLEIGGIHYPMAPFNGWYMGTEIGARNLADEDRYHLLPRMAALMGLENQSNRTLWKDKALVELNVAVLHSYQKAGVAIVDHHTAAQQFKRFEKNEKRSGREVTGNWAWLIPPLSPAATHIYHQPYQNKVKKPNFFYQKAPYSES